MFPTSYFPYGTPTYSYGGRPDSDYLQALAEEEAARRQYAEALRAQDEARNRAARARLARQAYESSHNSYLSDDDDDAYGGYVLPGVGYGYPSRRRPSYGYPTGLERQRLAALERERERERLRLLEEERERRRQMMEIEEERRRRRILEEEERRLQWQREAEERERMRLEQELLRRQQQSRQPTPVSPFEELFGLRPPRMAQSKSQESPFARRARTMSPGTRSRPTPPPAGPSPVERAASRTPPHERVPIHTPGSPAAKPMPTQGEPSPKPQARRPPTEQEIDAATKIQSRWRRHRALRIISEQATKFAELQKSFKLPALLDYVSPGSSIHSHEHVSVSVPSDLSSLPEEEDEGQLPKLAYTPTNAPVHMYEEELSRILTKLDGIESGGDDRVRKQRREVARSVEKEARRVERVKIAAWKLWTMKKEQPATVDAPEVAETGMDIDTPQTHGSDHEPKPEPSTPESTVHSAPQNVVLEAQPGEEDMVVELSEPTTASVGSDSPEDVVVESMPQPGQSTTLPIETPTDSTPHSSLPPLETDHADADVESDAPPATPDLSSHTQIPVAAEKVYTQSSTADQKLDSLRPLVEREWEDACDFF